MSPDHAATQNLINLRQKLIDLKADRTNYIKTADVLAHYEELCDQLLVHEQRFGPIDADTPNDSKSSAQLESEILLDDCFNLNSLFFLTVGRTLEPPAVYAPCTVIYRLLLHLVQSDNFSSKDLSPIHRTLSGYKDTIKRNGSTYNLRVIAILDKKVNDCIDALKPLQAKLDLISPQLAGIHEKLVSLRRCIKSAEARKKFSPADVESNLTQIKQIDATRIDGKFVAEDGTVPEEGQDQVQLVLQRGYEMAEAALKRQGKIAASLKDYAETLYRTNARLEKLELTQAWSLRETDLYDFLKTLTALDDKRVNGKFVAEDGSAPEEGQSILLYLLRRSYARAYTLMVSSEPVSEALMPIFNQLQTVRRCLKEVQKFGIQEARELYPYSMKLTSIDNMRVGGKFMVGSDIPEGQGRVASLLAECFEICQQLREEAPN